MHLPHALRRLARSPIEGIVAVVSLVVGIGAVAAMLGIADTLFLRPPPGVHDPERVVGIGPWANFQRATFPDYLDLKRDAASYKAIGAFATWDYTVRAEGEVVPARGMLATSTLLPLLGIRAIAGRLFLPVDDRPGAAPVALVSEAFWRRVAGRAAPAVGATMRVADRSFEIIGVLPASITAPDLSPIDVVLPIANAPWFGGAQALSSRAYHWVRIVGRLKANVTAARASAEATTIFRRANQGQAQVDQATLPHTVVQVRPIVVARQGPNTAVSRVLRWTTILAIALLLISCANVASILLAGGLRERVALAIRSALGASRGALLRYAVPEVLVLAALSMGPALVVAHGADEWFAGRFLGPSVSPPTLDLRTVGIVVAVTLGAMALCAIIPVLRASRTDPRVDLSGGSATMPASRRRLFRLLLVVQTGLCFVLVSEAILFGVSLRNATKADIGIKMDHLLIADVDLHAAGLTGVNAATAARHVIDRVRALPGVVTAGMTNAAAVPGFLTMGVTVPGSGVADDGSTVEGVNGVTADYVEALGLHVIAGRALTDMDVRAGRPVLLVSEGFVRHFWPRGSAIGQCVKIGGATSPCGQVMGVVSDRSGGPGDPRPDIEIYLPLGSDLIPQAVASIYPGREMAIRLSADPARVTARIRAALLDVLPQLTSVRVRTGEEYLQRQYRSWQFGTGVLSAFGLIALVLVGIGLFGVQACMVVQRVRELGIRRVLGATRWDLARFVLWEAVVVSAIGMFAGLIVAIAVVHVVHSLAFGVSPLDPRIYGVVGAVMLTTALVAAFVPALRAAATGPLRALRGE